MLAVAERTTTTRSQPARAIEACWLPSVGAKFLGLARFRTTSAIFRLPVILPRVEIEGRRGIVTDHAWYHHFHCEQLAWGRIHRRAAPADRIDPEFLRRIEGAGIICYENTVLIPNFVKIRLSLKP
jgi:hypothetical protein